MYLEDDENKQVIERTVNKLRIRTIDLFAYE